jgi:hypothetical protein
LISFGFESLLVRSTESEAISQLQNRCGMQRAVDGKVFVTDRATLDILNHKREKGSLRAAQWVFAVNLATDRIKRIESAPAVE